MEAPLSARVALGSIPLTSAGCSSTLSKRDAAWAAVATLLMPDDCERRMIEEAAQGARRVILAAAKLRLNINGKSKEQDSSRNFQRKLCALAAAGFSCPSTCTLQGESRAEHARRPASHAAPDPWPPRSPSPTCPARCTRTHSYKISYAAAEAAPQQTVENAPRENAPRDTQSGCRFLRDCCWGAHINERSILCVLSWDSPPRIRNFALAFSNPTASLGLAGPLGQQGMEMKAGKEKGSCGSALGLRAFFRHF
jgi:hypothetical protein